jgi:DNA-binding transcriptional ArsR family regulator
MATVLNVDFKIICENGGVDTADVLLHPVRLRIVQALIDGRVLTTSELCARLPDASKATVYRQVAVLVGAGFLAVDGERRVRGAVERRYRLHRARAVMDHDEIAAMTIEDHRRGFAALLAALLAEFNVYLDRDGADPIADSVSYRQLALWLSGEDLAEMLDEMRAAIRSRLGNGPSPDRAKYLFTPIFFPVEEPPTGA